MSHDDAQTYYVARIVHKETGDNVVLSNGAYGPLLFYTTRSADSFAAGWAAVRHLRNHSIEVVKVELKEAP